MSVFFLNIYYSEYSDSFINVDDNQKLKRVLIDFNYEQ